MAPGRRRRSWQAAKSLGELQTSCDPGVTEWGNPPRGTPAAPLSEQNRANGARRRELKHLMYLQEKKSKEIPKVAASEMGRAQTAVHAWRGCRTATSDAYG